MTTTATPGVRERIPTYCYQCVNGPDVLKVQVVDGVAAKAAAQARLARLDPLLALGGALPALLALGAAFAPPPFGTWMLALAGLACVAAGWTLKFVIVVRAAHLQGYAFGVATHSPNPAPTHL